MTQPLNPIARRALLQAGGGALLLGSAALRAQHRIEPWPAGRALPDLPPADLQGKPWRWADVRGKAVLVNFWATWCAPCKEEMPTLQTLADLEGQDLVVLAVNVREPVPRVARYAQTTGLRLPVLPDPRGEVTRAWGMTVFPTTVLVDAAGQPRQRITGAVDWTDAQAQAWIAALRA